MAPYILNFDTLLKQVGSFTSLSLDQYLNFRPLPLNVKCFQFNVKFCRLFVCSLLHLVWGSEGEVRILS